MLWPLFLIGLGVALPYAAAPLIRNVVDRHRATSPVTDEERVAFVRATPTVWLLPPLSFLSLGLIAAGLVWLVFTLLG